MRPEEMRPVVEVGFYLYGVGMVGEDSPLIPDDVIGISGAFTFAIDGFPVNADGQDDSGAPLWMQEELSMSVMLLESMTGWVEGRHHGAGCCFDYVELSILDAGDGRAEVISQYASAPETKQSALCDKLDLFRGFDQATAVWEEYYSRILPLLRGRLVEKPFTYNDMCLQRALDPGIWIVALSDWHRAYAAYQAEGQR